VSAGIVVFADDSVLIILNRYGEWVLPKGKIEPFETPHQAALREVLEETSVEAGITCSLGTTEYTYLSDVTGELVDKTVHWYAGTAMQSDDGAPPHAEPQREEGISSAGFVPWKVAVSMLKYDSNLVTLARKQLSD
jgi:8-oxo-dGTP pyrophosphatase MutT (NUDIX family)